MIDFGGSGRLVNPGPGMVKDPRLVNPGAGAPMKDMRQVNTGPGDMQGGGLAQLAGQYGPSRFEQHRAQIRAMPQQQRLARLWSFFQ